MKYVKMLGLAAVAAMALMAFLGASTASATVLCTENKNPCPAGEDYASGTEIHAVLEADTLAVLNAFWTDVECEVSTVKGKTTTTGGAGNVVGNVETLTFEECACAGDDVGSAHTNTLDKGTLEVAYTSGDDGKMTGKGQKVTVNCTSLGTQCIFGTKTEGTELGAATGGSPATQDANATVNHSTGTNDEGSFLCGSTAKWEASYEVTSPNPLHVASK